MQRPLPLAVLLALSALTGLVQAAPQDAGEARAAQNDRGVAPFRNDGDRANQRFDRAAPVRPEPGRRDPPGAGSPGRPDRPDNRPGDGHWDRNGRPIYGPGPHGYPVNRWYGPRAPYYRPSFGTRITILPGGYRTVWLGGLTYYVVDDIYYRRDADSYVVVSPPDEVIDNDDDTPRGGSSSEQEPFIYPNKGQDDKQQALDRYECHRWAVKQTGFDPTEPEGGVSRGEAWQKRDDYRRAETACLEGRGYTVR